MKSPFGLGNNYLNILFVNKDINKSYFPFIKVKLTKFLFIEVKRMSFGNFSGFSGLYHPFSTVEQI